MPNPPILSGSAKRLRYLSVIRFLPVKLKSSCCLTFFSISSIFLNASGVVLARKLNSFWTPFVEQRYAFCDDVLAMLESFSVRLTLFSFSLSMYLSHADGVPITDPRTLKPSTIVKLVPSNTFMALSRRFSFTMSLHLEGFTLYPKAVHIPVHICVPFLGDICRSSISGIIPIPHIALVRGSPCVVPSVDVKTVLLTYRFEGCLYELASAWCSAGQKIFTFLEQVFYWARWRLFLHQ